MARTLHEDVAGIDLFIPTAYDVFSIVTGALPNGNPALRQAANSDYRAYAPAPTMSPNIFKQRSYGWSLTCWYKFPNSDNTGHSTIRLENNLNNGTLGVNFPLSFSCAYNNSTGGTRFDMSYYGAAGNTVWSKTFNAINTWTFIAFMHPSPGQQAYSIQGRQDGGLITGMEQTFTNNGVVAAGSDTYASDLKFCLGRYSDNVATPQQYQNNDYGKIAFHNHLLTLTECQMLWQAMI